MSLQADTPVFQQGSWNWRRHVSEILNAIPNFRLVCLQFNSLSDPNLFISIICLLCTRANDR